MGDLTINFSRREFECKGKNCCSNTAALDMLLVYRLQELRTKIGKPLRVCSGFRCKTHNRSVGSDDNSQHVLGYAADILPPEGMTPDELAKIAENMGVSKWGGIGIYNTFVHFDIRETISRWRG